MHGVRKEALDGKGTQVQLTSSNAIPMKRSYCEELSPEREEPCLLFIKQDRPDFAARKKGLTLTEEREREMLGILGRKVMFAEMKSQKRSKGLDLEFSSLWVTRECSEMGWNGKEFGGIQCILRDFGDVCVSVCPGSSRNVYSFTGGHGQNLKQWSLVKRFDVSSL